MVNNNENFEVVASVQEEKLSSFEVLSKIDVSKHIEKKGKFNYLSWAWAWQILKKHYPTATYRDVWHNGEPFIKTSQGYFVEVEVTVEGIALSEIHPILDNNNRPVENPTTFQINTSQKRCLAKAIALHGLGLYIYAGEDLPMTDEEDGQTYAPKQSTYAPKAQSNTSSGAKVASEKTRGFVKSIIDKYQQSKKITEEEAMDQFKTNFGFDDINTISYDSAQKIIDAFNKAKG
jgi:hypothetical protein